MLDIAGIDHIVLRTTRLNAMLAFYCDILGCQVERETTPELGLTQLRAGNALIDLVDCDSQLGQMVKNPPDPDSLNLDHFCLQIQADSITEICQFLTEKKVAYSEPANRYGAQGFGLSVYLSDPDGNTIELKPKVRVSN